ncbi:MAG: L,D-transpeptidase family protein [Pseudolabrys sp.]
MFSTPSIAQTVPGSRGAPPVAYDQLPAHVLSEEERNARRQEELRQRYWRERREAESGVPGAQRAPTGTLPQPAFVAPPGQQPPAAGGHQIDRSASSNDVVRPPGAVGAAAPSSPASATAATVATLPPEDQPETGPPKELPEHLKRQLVDLQTKESPGTIIVDTDNTYLYLVMPNGKAMRYGIGVGREGFTWSGKERVSNMKEWPDWHPPAEMIERQPYLPRFMAGGPGNPLGARALYLGKTLYRIHGTNQPSTIGSYVSSGCIRLLNNDIEDLYSRVKVGTSVVVWESTRQAGPPPTDISAPNTAAASAGPAPLSPTANAAPVVPGSAVPGGAAPPLPAPTTLR